MSGKDIKRRSVLKQISSASMIAVCLSSSSAAGKKTAKAGNHELAEQFDKKDKVEHYLKRDGNDVLRELADRNIIDRPKPTDFALNTRLERERIQASEEIDGWAVTQYRTNDKNGTADIMVSKSTDKHSFTIHIQPQANESYVFVHSKESGEEFIIDPSTESVKLQSRSSDDVSTSGTCCGDCDDYRTCGDTYCSRSSRTHESDICTYYTVYMSCSWDSGTESCLCYEDGKSCENRISCEETC